MSEIKVKVIDKKTLEILEEAKPGDRIDLSSITTIDEDYINEAINNAKNDFATQRINEKEEQYRRDLQTLEEKYAMNNKIAIQNEAREKDELLSKIKSEYEKRLMEAQQNVTKLEAEIRTLNTISDSNLKVQLSEQTNKLKEIYDKEILNLNNQINKLTSEIKSQEEINNNKLARQRADLERDFEVKLSAAKDEKNELTRELDNMKLQKSYQSVKMIGESLEKWCNEEYQNAQLSGFDHCSWEKDNDAVKDDLDTTDRASKADYIFKMYTNDNFTKVNEITSVCLEMKSESPNSTNKRTNESYAKRLDINRKKKDCEYALLVSELEWTEDNDAPIKKMPGYDKMYMVRPQYMITFLSIVYSLGKRYRDLILTLKENDEELREIVDIDNEFETFKETYVLKPIESLAKQCETMRKKASTIIDCANDINKEIDLITSKTIQTIKEKIATFTVKKDKLNRKIAKLEK